MYAVVGTDGVVYGPVPLATLYDWIAQGRLVPTSELIDAQGRRLPASMAPELRGAFPTPLQAPYGQAFYGVPTAYGPSKRKSTALWLAFLLGPLGAHRFYLGHRASGFAMLVLNLAMCGVGLRMGLVLFVASTLWLIADVAMISSGALREKGT